jgi:hypothetical protein
MAAVITTHEAQATAQAVYTQFMHDSGMPGWIWHRHITADNKELVTRFALAFTEQALENAADRVRLGLVAERLEDEINRLREGLDLSWEEAINAVPSKCEGLSVCEPMCHDNIRADLRAARADAQEGP